MREVGFVATFGLISALLAVVSGENQLKTSSPSLKLHGAADLHTETHQMPENKQTNQPTIWGSWWLSRFHLIFQFVRVIGLLPLTWTQTRTQSLPRPCCRNKAPTVCVCSGESAWDNVRLPSTQAAIQAFWAGWTGAWGVRGGGGWAFIGGGMTDGLCVGTVPRPACPLVKEASDPPICNADLPPRSVNGWHKAGLR